MARDIDRDEFQTWVDEQLLALQLRYMEARTSGAEVELGIFTEVMDALYEMRTVFLEIPTPAPGQGYEPPPGVWDEHTRQKAVEALDAQIAELERLRQQLQES